MNDLVSLYAHRLAMPPLLATCREDMLQDSPAYVNVTAVPEQAEPVSHSSPQLIFNIESDERRHSHKAGQGQTALTKKDTTQRCKQIQSKN